MPTIKTLTAEVVGDTLALTQEEQSIDATPLASVPESASADTVIVVKDGVPKQTPVSDLLAPIESDVQDLEDVISAKVGRLAVNIGGIAVTSAENGWYYSANIPITGLPSGAVPFSVTPYGSFDIGVIPQLRDNANLVLQSARSLTTTSGRLAVVGYYIP